MTVRILIHSINFSPELTGIGKYSGELAEWLVAQGREVPYCNGIIYYPQWRVADGYANGCGIEKRFKGQRRAEYCRLGAN